MDDKLTMHHSMFADDEKPQCKNCHFYYLHPGCVKRDGKPHNPITCFEPIHKEE